MASRREYHGNLRAPDFPTGAEWINSKAISLADLKGKLVLLDFWTYGCINCIHVIPDLKRLEERFPNELVVIGVHSAKFKNEGDTANLRQIVARYEITHPVVNDRDMTIWERYAVRAWPTTILIDPQGRVLAQHSGEGVYDAFENVIQNAVEQYQREGILNRTPLTFLAPASTSTQLLAFPGKVIVGEARELLAIADTGHNRVVIAGLDGRVHHLIGSGEVGFRDGEFDTAQLNKPQGLALDGDQLYIADTNNHALRVANLQTRQVSTLAGDGVLTYHISEGAAAKTRLNSPWDLLLLGEMLYIAMAGLHQVYFYDTAQHTVEKFAGSGREGLVDAYRLDAAMAQPSGLSALGNYLYVADSEASAIRSIDLEHDGMVRTLVGEGLFEFGDVDGDKTRARLQHALGVAAATGRLYIADTYNHKIKVLDLASGTLQTLFGSGKAGMKDGATSAFYEPGGIAYSREKLYIADTNNHVVRVADLATRSVSTFELEMGVIDQASDRSAADVADAAPLPEGNHHEATLQLQLELPEHCILTAGQPSQLTWELQAKASGRVLGSGEETFTVLEPVFRFAVPQEPSILQVNLKVFYCNEDDGLCLLDRRAFTISDIGDLAANNGAIKVPVEVT